MLRGCWHAGPRNKVGVHRRLHNRWLESGRLFRGRSSHIQGLPRFTGVERAVKYRSREAQRHTNAILVNPTHRCLRTGPRHYGVLRQSWMLGRECGE